MAVLLNPKFWLSVAAAVFLAAYGLFCARLGRAPLRAEFDAYKLSVQQQAETMREARAQTARDASVKETARTFTRTVYIVKKTKEIDHDAQALAACPIPDRTVRVLGDIARCAREDRSTACQPDGAVPGAR